MKRTIISTVLALVMLVPFAEPAWAKSQNNGSQDATYIDLTNNGKDEKKGNQQPKNDANNPQNRDNYNDEGEPIDNDNDIRDTNTYAENTDNLDEAQNIDANVNAETESSLSYLFALIIAGVALAFSIICFLKLRKVTAKKKTATKPGKQPWADKIDELAERTTKLESSIKELNNQIALLSRATQQSFRPQNQYESSNAGRTKAPETRRTKYAQTVIGDGFPADTLSDNAVAESIAVLNINGNRAKFVINPDMSAQKRLLMNFNYSVGRISNVLSKTENPTQIMTVQPGEAELRGNMWFILNKASVKLV